MFGDRRVAECDVVRRKDLLINGGTARETKHVALAGQITVGRKENRLKERAPVVCWQICVRNGNWNRRSAGFGIARPDLGDRSFHWQKRILSLRRAVIGDSELSADLREIDPVDGFKDQRQRIRICFRLLMRMFVVKAVTEHVLFTVRYG